MNKENETYKKIIDIAKKEFLEKNFQEASLRKIAREAGVTTGAFYRYFHSKEELFDALVDEHASYIIDLLGDYIDDFEQMPIDQQTDKMTSYSSQAIDLMIDYIYDHYDFFKILICSSYGDKYNSFFDSLVEEEENSTYAYIKAMEDNGVMMPLLDHKLVHIICSGLINGMFEIIRHDMTKKEAKKYIYQLFAFQTGGWSAIMNIDFKNYYRET